MTRIVGGTAGGRRIETPSGSVTRPTSDRAREGLFNTLDGLVDLRGAVVLDLYAGSGALGIEALSRGAARAVFVESAPAAAAVIKANLAALDLAGQVIRAPVAHALRRLSGARVDVVFADPPYPLAAAELRDVLRALVADGLSDDAVLVVERSARDNGWDWPAGITAVKSRRYGEATLWYGRRP